MSNYTNKKLTDHENRVSANELVLGDHETRITKIEATELIDTSVNTNLIEVELFADVPGGSTIKDELAEGQSQFIRIERDTSKVSQPNLDLKLNEAPDNGTETDTFTVYIVRGSGSDERIDDVNTITLDNNSRTRFQYVKASRTFNLESERVSEGNYSGPGLAVQEVFIHILGETQDIRLDTIEKTIEHQANTNDGIGTEETTFTGNVAITGTPTAATHLTPKTYVDTQVSTKTDEAYVDNAIANIPAQTADETPYDGVELGFNGVTSQATGSTGTGVTANTILLSISH
jgi:hypothetical protein